MPRPLHHLRRSRSGAPGYTLIEALLMVVILSFIAIAVGNSLIGAARSTEANENTLQIDNALVSQMEILRSAVQQSQQSYPLGAQTSQITIGNSVYTMTTDVEKADPTGQQILQPTFVSLSVQIAGRSTSTYVSFL